MAIQGSHRGMPITIPDFDTDTMGYWQAAAQHKLVIKKCKSCGHLRFPPNPGCFWCMSMDWEWQEVSGKGTLYSLEIVTHAVQPAFRDWVPYIVALVELDEDRGAPFNDHIMHRRYGIPHPDIAVRHLANLVREEGGTWVPEKEENAAIGARVEVAFYDSDNITIPMWKLSAQQPPASQLWHYEVK